MNSVVLAADRYYVKHVSVAIISLLSNNPNTIFSIYLINDGIEKTDLIKIKLLVEKFDSKFMEICIHDLNFDKYVTTFHFSKAMYFRLLIPEFIEDEKVLYLDSDVVVDGDISSLFEVDLENYYIAGVEDPFFDRHLNLRMCSNSKYFNSGVMLINNIKWKESNFIDQVKNFIETHSSFLIFPDQDALNSIIDGHWKKLQLNFNQQTVFFSSQVDNYFSKNELKIARSKPLIIHYTGTSKPWQLCNKHPYKELYWKYRQGTPFSSFFYDDFSFKSILICFLPLRLKKYLKKIINLF